MSLVSRTVNQQESHRSGTRSKVTQIFYSTCLLGRSQEAVYSKINNSLSQVLSIATFVKEVAKRLAQDIGKLWKIGDMNKQPIFNEMLDYK